MRYVILWIVFAVLFFGAQLGLELLEGNKIATTEYYGLRNIGFAVLFIYFALPLIVYPVTFLPVTVVARRFVKAAPPRAFLYACLGGSGGAWMFDRQYDDYFVRDYGLHLHTAVWLFAAAGLLYGLAERFIPVPRSRQ